jgi:hypothetical protein
MHCMSNAERRWNERPAPPLQPFLLPLRRHLIAVGAPGATNAINAISAEPSPLGGLPFQGSLVYGTVTMLTGSRATKQGDC